LDGADRDGAITPSNGPETAELMSLILDAASAIWAWLNRPEGIVPWAEHNQGLLSVVALVFALGVAVLEYRRALKAEARARSAAREAKAQAEAEAQEAKIRERLSFVHEFAIAAKGVLVDVELDLARDRDDFRKYPFDEMAMLAPADRVRQGAKASAETLNALLAGVPLSPSLIRATRQGACALNAVADDAQMVNVQDYQETYAAWIAALEVTRAAITDAQLEFEHRVRPSRTEAMSDALIGDKRA